MSIENKVSALIESQFPEFALEEGPKLVAFLKAYYEWMETSGQALYEAKKFPENQDIDTTSDKFLEYFKTKFNLDVQMLSQGVSILYSFFANKKKVEERMVMPMSKIITSITGKEFPPNQLFIILELLLIVVSTFALNPTTCWKSNDYTTNLGC